MSAAGKTKQKSKFGWGDLILPLIVSLFVGYVIVTIGLGSAFPTLLTIAAPFVCDGEFTVVTSQKPGSDGGVATTYKTFCQGSSGPQNEITFATTMVAGLIYSAVLLPITALLLYRLTSTFFR